MQMLSTKHRTITGYDFTKDDALPPASAIRAQCRHCTCNMSNEIRNCTASAHPTNAGGCFLWPFRLGHGMDFSKGHPKISRRKAMRRECLRCMSGSSLAVRECESTHCPLWPYRHGKGVEDVNGHRQREISAKQREAAAERFARMRLGATESGDYSPESTNAVPVDI